jgi:hypothetical protein
MKAIARPPLRPDTWVRLPKALALFRRVRRGLRARAVVHALEATATATLASWLAAMAADAALSLPASTRLVALGAICAAAGGTFTWFLARGAAGRIGPAYLAARVEALHPEFANRLIAAVELATSRAGPERAEDGVAPLVFEQAEALASKVDPVRVVAAESERTKTHKYLLLSMALVLASALVAGEEFPKLATRSLFPWLHADDPAAAFFGVRPRAVEVEEGERFSVAASLRGPAPERVVLELDLGSDAGPAGERAVATRGSTRAEMAEGPVPRRWSAEAGPVRGPGRFRLAAEYGPKGRPVQSSWFPVRLLVRPRALSVSVSYAYPAYTGRPGKRDAGGAIDAPVGTTATVELVPERPLARATVLTGDRRRIAMRRAAPSGPESRPDRASTSAGGGEAWTFSLGVARSGSYRVELESADGVESRTESYPVTARPDRAPRCEASFVDPPDGAELDVSSRGAAFRVRAADDFGLREFTLVVKWGASEREAEKDARDDVCCIPVPGFSPGAREFSRELRVPPQVLPVAPGVTYTYYVRAADGYPPSPHISTSPEQTFRISRAKRSKALLAAEAGKKLRPPLLEPPDDTPGAPPPSQTGNGKGDGREQPPSRGLAGLSEGERQRGDGRRARGEQEPSGSPYASTPGLGVGGKDVSKDGGKDAGKDEGGRGGDQGEDEGKGRPGDEGSGRSGREVKRREEPQLPGQGGPPGADRAPQRNRTAAGGQGQGPGAGTEPGGGGSEGRAGRRPGRGGPPRRAPDATGSGPDGGGRANAGKQEKRLRDGGMPTGAETGTGPSMPETVDEDAVAGLDVSGDELSDVRVPPRTSGPGKYGAGRGGPSTDLGRGLDRDVGRAAGRDRAVIPKDELPTPAVVRSRPVGRMYRALVAEYFRRLEELADEP